MGPRAAGFLVGSAISAVGCLLLLRYDVLHRHDLQNAQVTKLEQAVDHLLLHRGRPSNNVLERWELKITKRKYKNNCAYKANSDVSASELRCKPPQKEKSTKGEAKPPQI